MELHRIVFRAASLGLACLATSACGAADSSTIAFREVNVVDVVDGGIDRRRTVVVAGDRIVAIGPADEVEIPGGARVVDAADGYLMPGLWDMHVHLTDATELALPVLLANGVTGVRDAGGDIELLQRLERERAGGVRRSPRLVVPGPYVDGAKELPHRIVVETADDGRAAADSLARAGVDYLKIHNGVPREAYFALVDRARELGLPVVGHIPMEVAPGEAARAGQTGVEHFATLFEGTLRQRVESDPLAFMRRYVESGLDTLVASFAAADVWFTPTLHAYWIRAKRGELAADPDPRLRYVAPSLRQQWDAWFPVREQDSAPEVVAAREAFYRVGLDIVAAADGAGVRLLAGTDLALRDVLPGFHLHDELAALVEAGLSPHAALRTATLNPARFLGREGELGTVAQGKLADLVLLDANPLEDVRNTRRIRAVMVDGELLDREALREMLGRVERAVEERLHDQDGVATTRQ
ncbi:MAG: amidohydrolase family protein [Gemmatimonadota bacterium]